MQVVEGGALKQRKPNKTPPNPTLSLLTPASIKAIRKHLKMTADKFAFHLGIEARETIYRWESGRDKPSRTMKMMMLLLLSGVDTAAPLKQQKKLDRRIHRLTHPPLVTFSHDPPRWKKWMGLEDEKEKAPLLPPPKEELSTHDNSLETKDKS